MDYPSLTLQLDPSLRLLRSLWAVQKIWAEHLTWAALLLLILTRGPGAIALDRFIAFALFSRREG